MADGCRCRIAYHVENTEIEKYEMSFDESLADADLERGVEADPMNAVLREAASPILTTDDRHRLLWRSRAAKLLTPNHLE